MGSEYAKLKPPGSLHKVHLPHFDNFIQHTHGHLKSQPYSALYPTTTNSNSSSGEWNPSYVWQTLDPPLQLQHVWIFHIMYYSKSCYVAWLQLLISFRLVLKFVFAEPCHKLVCTKLIFVVMKLYDCSIEELFMNFCKSLQNGIFLWIQHVGGYARLVPFPYAGTLSKPNPRPGFNCSRKSKNFMLINSE